MNSKHIVLVGTSIGMLLALAACAPTGHRGCTVVTVSQGEEAYFGCNDDWHNRDSTYWVDPRGPDKYGGVYFGDPDNVQQGFNEKGLAYDANGLPRTDITAHPGTIPVFGRYAHYSIAILRDCATVGEVLTWVESHQWHEFMHDQMHFADASGDAVVISVGRDGRVAYTRKPGGDSLLVTTNFNVANPANGSYPCWRYDLATRRLSELLANRTISQDSVASVMEAVHVERTAAWTLYTLVADLQRGLVSIYFMFQYDDPIVLNIEAELARGPVRSQVSSLFPDETIRRAELAYERLFAGKRLCETIGFIWIGLVALCVAIAASMVASCRIGALALLVVSTLGPLGLLLAVIGNRQTESQKKSGGQKTHSLTNSHTWRRSLWTAGLDIAPIVPTVAGCLLLSLFIPAIGNSSGRTLLLLVLAPLAIAQLAVQAPIRAVGESKGYARAVVQSAARSFPATCIALATVFPVAAPAAVWTVGQCGADCRVVLPIWGLAALGSAIGVGLLAVYHRVRHPEGLETTQSRSRRSGVWVVAGVVVLVVGIVLSSRVAQWFAR